MNEFEVGALISQGENESLDFKRILNLESKVEKGEFVKDVISVANSSSRNKGYILVGVDDSENVIGIDKIEEERIQQIIHGYVRPILRIRCFLVHISIRDSLFVGVIEITGIHRPYHVARPVGNLSQDDVFIRHGSIVMKANFEELERMRKETQQRQEIQRFIETAEIHSKLGNFKEAINSYSKAIDVAPTPDLFYARGIAYKTYAISVKKSEKFSKELLYRSIKDLSDVIQLAETRELEKSARLERFRIFEIDYDEWLEDSEWLRENTQGYELGEVLFLDCRTGEDRAGITSDASETTLKDLNYAIELGYKESEVYELRARTHFFMHNYGLAMEDINVALQNPKSIERSISILCLKASTEAKIGKFNDSLESYEKARSLSSDLNFSDWWGYVEENVDGALWNCCLVQEFGRKESKIPQVVAQALLIKNISKEVTRIAMRGNKIISAGPGIAGKKSIEEEHPNLIPILIEMVGEDFWERCEWMAQTKLLKLIAD